MKKLFAVIFAIIAGIIALIVKIKSPRPKAEEYAYVTSVTLGKETMLEKTDRISQKGIDSEPLSRLIIEVADMDTDISTTFVLPIDNQLALEKCMINLSHEDQSKLSIARMLVALKAACDYIKEGDDE